MARAVLTGAVAEIPDAQADPEYEHADGARAKGFLSLLAVPDARVRARSLRLRQKVLASFS